MIESDNIDNINNISTSSNLINKEEDSSNLISDKSNVQDLNLSVHPDAKGTIENVPNEEGKGGVIGQKNMRLTELSPDCQIGADAAPSDLLKQIIKVDVTKTLQDKLTVRKFCFTRLSVEKIMQWQKSEIDEPLLKMEKDEDRAASLQMFRNLLSYMMDRKSSKRPILHAKKLIKIALKGSPLVRDEAYLQIYKQLHGNKKYDSLIRGWKFLAILASCFGPSEDIYNLIMNFLFFEMQNSDDAQVVKHAKYIFVRMIKINGHDRRNVPCVEELEYIEYLKSIPVPINFFTGTQTTVKIESYTTIRELKTKMMDVLDFNPQRAIYYSVYEVCNRASGTTEERFIDDSEKVCDIISVWKSDMDKAAKKMNETITFKFYLKLLVYYSFDREDVDTISVVYYQTVYDVLTGKFNMDESKVISLAALQAVNEFGTDRDSAQKSISKNVEKYIPCNKIGQNTAEEYSSKIIQKYTDIMNTSKNDAKWNYLEELKTLTTYQTQQFDAKFNLQKSGTNDDNIPDECIIGFKPDGILILNRDRTEVVFYKYEVIMNWGISKNQFIICISNLDNDMKKVCFFTTQTKVIQCLIEIYCNILAGKTMKEIQGIVNTYDSKFEKIDSSRRRLSTVSFKRDKVQEENKEEKEQESIEEINKIEQEIPEQIIPDQPLPPDSFGEGSIN